ncbi:cysteine desulfurase [Candidatus Saccharibacteria bacterium]|nr:cysteine desulfurase [Candidatus Saccharibacteria bacterium]
MIYLDYAATAPILPDVVEAMSRAQRQLYGNASALHTSGHNALNEIERCRDEIAKFIGAKPSEIYFNSGSTEGNNTVINIFDGHIIKTSDIEHPSILESAKLARGDKYPILYSYMFANNETGELLDINDIVRKSQKETFPSDPDLLDFSRPFTNQSKAAYVHSDLTQALGKVPINVDKLGIDYATFSSHKIGGPTGVGAIYVREGVPFKPLLVGGHQEKGFRAGTYNTVGIIGFAAALQANIKHHSFEKYDSDIRILRDKLAKRILSEIPGSSLNTDIAVNKSLPNILNVSFKAAEGESIQLYLDSFGIIVSTGSACASGSITPSHVLMAKTGDAEVAHSSIRFSFGLNNTIKDVDAVMDVLPGIIKRLQGISTIDA